jgi:hypothetical protein
MGIGEVDGQDPDSDLAGDGRAAVREGAEVL